MQVGHVMSTTYLISQVLLTSQHYNLPIAHQALKIQAT